MKALKLDGHFYLLKIK